MQTASTNQVLEAVQLICELCKKTAAITFTIAVPLFITSFITAHNPIISVIQNSKASHNNDISLILITVSFIFIIIATLINGIILFIALIIALSSKGYSKKVLCSMAYMLINIPIAVAYEILTTELL
ncbi:hypothetical protein V1389_07630 [Flavobacterium rakeshii]|uniref:hypothetical protein n=1 Tax=Flavobacterium rakeshii TaxID=1038845 RepID=UPI002E7B2F47|nr:hypothetical protein [Flavobacterium rakeshii]MEE1898200.1 hypothetical protein [Flavobacterium rakeshii]